MDAKVVHSTTDAAVRLLRERRYHEAWPLYEARRSDPRYDLFAYDAPMPEWRDEDPRGRRLVVCAEQGFGDQIMFGRWLPMLVEMGCEVVVACHPALERLFQSLGCETAPARKDRPLPPGDFWTYFGSLPLRSGVSTPPEPAYLPFGPEGSGIGVVTTGNPAHHNDANRSLSPAIAEQMRSLGRDVSPEATGAYEFLTTAHIFMGLGRLVTVDTAAAHLAGAMGLPTTVLLPFDGLDWRWNDGVRSDWYPSAHLHQQPAPGDWASIVAAVSRDLGER